MMVQSMLAWFRKTPRQNVGAAKNDIAALVHRREYHVWYLKRILATMNAGNSVLSFPDDLGLKDIPLSHLAMRELNSIRKLSAIISAKNSSFNKGADR